MPKYNDFELDLTITKAAEEEKTNSVSTGVTVISRHNSCATHCNESVIICP